MSYNWFNLFNLQDFLDTNLVSRTYEVDLQGYGSEEITLCRGQGVSVVFRERLLQVNFDGQNPYQREELAIFIDADEDVWLGIEVTQ